MNEQKNPNENEALVIGWFKKSFHIISFLIIKIQNEFDTLIFHQTIIKERKIL